MYTTELKNVPTEQCTHSRFNTRSIRGPKQIERLSERIRQMGFERTRAPWCVEVDGQYEIFAGGTRLEAARVARLSTIPILLYTDLTDEDISHLSDVDNENDEYHVPLSPVEVWVDYARLRDEEGWTQEKIARAKEVNQARVSERLKFYTLSERVKGFIQQGFMTEGHLRGITSIFTAEYFSPWLTTEQAWEELAELVVMGIRKDGKKSTRATAKDVESWKRFVTEADKVYQSLSIITLYNFPDEGDPQPFEYDAPAMFVSELAKREARTITGVREATRAIRLYIRDNLSQYEVYIREKSATAARAAIQAEREEQLLSYFFQGDCIERLKNWQGGKIKVLLSDPPYGKDYQSNRRWITTAPDKIVGDKQQDAPGLWKDMIEAAIPHLADDAHVLLFADWRGEPEVRQILQDTGLKVKGLLIWVKEEHSAGDLTGSFAPRYECIVHAVKGSPTVTPRIPDVLEFSRSRETSHPMEKPTSLLRKLILSTSAEGDLIIDPFAGCGNVLLAAMKEKRNFWGAEIDVNYHDEGCARLIMEDNDARK